MRKMIFVFSLMAVLAIGGPVAAQDMAAGVNPMLREGVQELGIQGNIDLDDPQGSLSVELDATYGWFLNQNLEVGPFIGFSRTTGGDVMRYGLGVFAEYHLLTYDWVGFAQSVPYVGASLGLEFLDTDLPGEEDQSGLTLTPVIGVKWFFRDYVAVDTNFFLAWSSDDVYTNDEELDNYDFGFNLGLRVYFE